MSLIQNIVGRIEPAVIGDDGADQGQGNLDVEVEFAVLFRLVTVAARQKAAGQGQAEQGPATGNDAEFRAVGDDGQTKGEGAEAFGDQVPVATLSGLLGGDHQAAGKVAAPGFDPGGVGQKGDGDGDVGPLIGKAEEAGDQFGQAAGVAGDGGAA